MPKSEESVSEQVTRGAGGEAVAHTQTHTHTYSTHTLVHRRHAQNATVPRHRHGTRTPRTPASITHITHHTRVASRVTSSSRHRPQSSTSNANSSTLSAYATPHTPHTGYRYTGTGYWTVPIHIPHISQFSPYIISPY